MSLRLEVIAPSLACGRGSFKILYRGDFFLNQRQTKQNTYMCYGVKQEENQGQIKPIKERGKTELEEKKEKLTE